MSLVSEATTPQKLTDEEIFAGHVDGKLSVETTAPLDSQRALSIAYTPGVAQVSRAIAADETLADRYTWTNRLVVVVSDGSAVLGLGRSRATPRVRLRRLNPTMRRRRWWSRSA